MVAHAVCREQSSQTRSEVILNRKDLIGLAVLLALILTVTLDAQTPLTSLKAIHDLDNVEAGKGLPVSIEATVTYFNAVRDDLFVQDGPIGIYIWKTAASS